MAANVLATSVTVSGFSCASSIHGYHDYKDIWTPETGEVLEVEAEPSNPHDPMATAVKKNGQVVGHVPRSLARYTHFFLLRQGNQIVCEVSGSPVNRSVGLGLEVPCFYHFDGQQNFLRKLQDSLKE